MSKQMVLGAAYLSVFGVEQQKEIISFCRNSSPGEIANALDRTQNPLLPPGLFSMIGSSSLLEDKEKIGAIWAIISAALFAMKGKNLSASFYRDILINVFMIDETEALKLAEKVDTIDDAAGIIDNPAYLLAAVGNSIGRFFGASTSFDLNSKDDDLDAAWELVQFGEIIMQQIKRRAVMASSLSDKLNTGISPDVERLVAAARQAEVAKESGDIVGVGSYEPLRQLANRYAPLPIPYGEQGGFFQTLGKIGKGIINAASTAMGVGPILGPGKSAEAAPAPAAPVQMSYPPQGGRSSSAAMDAMIAEKTGNTLIVRSC